MSLQAAVAPSPQHLLARARLEAGDWDAAEPIYRAVLEHQPADREALQFMVNHSLRRGASADARRWLEQATERLPQDVGLHCQRAYGLIEAGQEAAADALLASLIKRVPGAPAPRLYRGLIAERSSQPVLAAQHYFRGITLAQLQGLWQSLADTPSALRPLVQQAMYCVNRERRQLFEALLDPLRAHHSDMDLQRVVAGLHMYLGDLPRHTGHALQQPKFLYVPELGDQAFFAPANFAWVPALEREAQSIRTELMAVLDSRRGIEPFLKLSATARPQDYLGLRDDAAAWDAFFFWRHGDAFTANQARCPRTTAALEALPLTRIPAHAPEVCFSILKPGTHIKPHHGVTNTRLVCHLPLIVPSGCRLRVGEQQHVWRQDEVVVFDDSYEHEAWNDSEDVRVVMIFDVWHPALHALEQDALTRLVTGIGAFNNAVEQL